MTRPRKPGPRRPPPFVVGVISDTHGLMRPEALQALRGSDHILHAGDIGSPHVIEALRTIAPVTAVRGNCDVDFWSRTLPETIELELGGQRLCLLHERRRLGMDGPTPGCQVVVFGHSHAPYHEREGRCFFFNPGSAGPRRFRLPVTVGRLRIGSAGIDAAIIQI
jgi:putative phosphoesterase